MDHKDAATRKHSQTANGSRTVQVTRLRVAMAIQDALGCAEASTAHTACLGWEENHPFMVFPIPKALHCSPAPECCSLEL